MILLDLPCRRASTTASSLRVNCENKALEIMCRLSSLRRKSDCLAAARELAGMNVPPRLYEFNDSHRDFQVEAGRNVTLSASLNGAHDAIEIFDVGDDDHGRLALRLRQTGEIAFDYSLGLLAAARRQHHY